MVKKNISAISAEDIASNISTFGKSLLYKDRPTRKLSMEERNELWEVKRLPTFDEFCKDPEHMNFPPLSDRQKSASDFMIGGDPTQAFNNQNSRCVLVWGKGSGKDSIAVLMTAYITFLLLNIKNPQLYFGRTDIDTLDIVNVAASGKQAKDVYFDKFTNIVKSWKWLRKRYKIIESGIPLSSDIMVSNDVVKIMQNGIIFPKQIRAISGNSEQETQEGKNIICFVLDEFSAFQDKTKTRNAGKIFKRQV